MVQNRYFKNKMTKQIKVDNTRTQKQKVHDENNV